MKPRNFPGRRYARYMRAGDRNLKGVADRPAFVTDPTVADIRWRIGGKNRDAITGVGRTAEE